jgi:flagellar motor switch protein FliG
MGITSGNQPGSTPEKRPEPAGGPAMTLARHGEERVALLLKTLPIELAEAVLGRMISENASRLRDRMQAAPAGSSPEAAEVLHGFVERVRRAAAPAAESPAPKDAFEPSDAAKAILNAIDTAPVSPSRELAETPTGPEADDLLVDDPASDPVQELRNMGAVITAAVLKGERTPTIVAALRCLATADASDVLRRLPPERRREATLRLARGGPGNPELRRAVARAVVRLGRVLGADPAALDGDAEARKLAELLRGLERDDRKEVLETLTKDDPSIAEKVKNLLYVFEDLLRIEDRSVQALLAEVEMKTLAVALGGAEDVMMKKVMNNLSQRARDTLTEEMSLLGKPRASQVKESRALVVTVIQRLDGEGKLVMIE